MMTAKKKILLIASTGGHLAQLWRLRDRLGAAEDSLWVTFDSPQSRSLLRDRRVLYVPYIAPRDFRAVLRAFRILQRTLRNEKFDQAISTGAALALAGLPAARLNKIPAMYIESVSRLDGPSITGRLLALFRLAHLRTQHVGWASRRWKPIPSVLEEYERRDNVAVDRPELKVFVTLGTIKPYRFDAAVDAVKALGLPEVDVTWQLGVTSREDIALNSFDFITAEKFHQYAVAADVVITHAGVGSLLALLELGVYPIVIPRRASRREHVDDHQLQAAGMIEATGLGTVVEPGTLTISSLREAARRGISAREN